MINILVTGGLGYIGSHIVIELLKNHNVVIIDNLTNSSLDTLYVIERLHNSETTIDFYKDDIRNYDNLVNVFTNHNISVVIHLAGLKSVKESYSIPDVYYDNNVDGTKILLNVMNKFNCNNIIFSSSATVYGDSISPVTETQVININNIASVYGLTKYYAESLIIKSGINYIILRYFNPIGSHTSGYIGDSPNGIPNNIVPCINNVLLGVSTCLTIYGNDYGTPDGTCIRDYIHVMDLADAHIESVKYILNTNCKDIFNVGTGVGTSVMELYIMTRNISDIYIPYKIGNRRVGDIPELYANCEKIKNVIGWSAKRTTEEAIKSNLQFISHLLTN